MNMCEHTNAHAVCKSTVLQQRSSETTLTGKVGPASSRGQSREPVGQRNWFFLLSPPSSFNLPASKFMREEKVRGPELLSTECAALFSVSSPVHSLLEEVKHQEESLNPETSPSCTFIRSLFQNLLAVCDLHSVHTRAYNLSLWGYC